MNAISQPLGRSSILHRTTVADAMTAGLISCAPETSLSGVARLMTRHRIHAVFVFDYGHEDDESAELWGLVSDLDLVAAAPGDFAARTAADTAVTPLFTVDLDEPVAAAAELMSLHGVSHLAVVDPATRRPAGVVSTLDIAELLASPAA